MLGGDDFCATLGHSRCERCGDRIVQAAIAAPIESSRAAAAQVAGAGPARALEFETVSYTR
jgi:hypothetical protein